MMLYEIVVRCETDDIQGAKEILMVDLEKVGKAKLVSIEPQNTRRLNETQMQQMRLDGWRQSPYPVPPKEKEPALRSGPFARADAALKAAMEANEEIRG